MVSRLRGRIVDRRLIDRVAWGAQCGLALGVAFAVLAMVGWLLGAREVGNKLGIGLATIVLVYTAVGVLGGVLVGNLQPWTRHRTIAALLGFLIGLVLMAAIQGVTHGSGPWTSEDTIVLLIDGLLVGPAGGLIYREIFWERDQQK